MAKTRSVSFWRRFSTNQWIVAIVLGLSLMANVAVIAFVIIASQPSADFALENYTLGRVCNENLDYDLKIVETSAKQNGQDPEKQKAFYSVSVCAGYNYKTHQQLSDDVNRMVDEVMKSK
jgi:hypothetical protein